MKKLLSIGLLGMCAFALAEHRAQAWVNSKFMIGLNWHHQSGNTSYLWGLWRNGQVPGPEAFGAQAGPPPGMVPPGMVPGGYPPPQAAPFPYFGGGAGAQPNGVQPGAYYSGRPQGYPYAANPQAFYPQGNAFGYYPQANSPQGFPQGLPSDFLTQTTPPPLVSPAQPQSPNSQGQGMQRTNAFTSVSYQPNSYYQPTYYYYPAYNYEAPYYWYGVR